MHTHDLLEFGFVFKGTGTYHIDGVDYIAEAGDLFVVPPGVSHYEKHDPDKPFELLFFMVRHDGKGALQLNELLLGWKGKHSGYPVGQLKGLINDIYHEIIRQEAGYLAVIDGKLKEIYIMLYRQLQAHEGFNKPIRRSSEDRNDTVLKEIKVLIHEHISQPMTVEDLAQHFYYHPKYLSDIFKRDTGRSIAAYISEIRMDRARELLTQTDIPMEQLSAQLGFSSLQHFYKWFKKTMFVTPVTYRKQYLQAPQDPFCCPPTAQSRSSN